MTAAAAGVFGGTCKLAAIESRRHWCHAAPQCDQVKKKEKKEKNTQTQHDVTGWFDIDAAAVAADILVFLAESQKRPCFDEMVHVAASLKRRRGQPHPRRDSFLYHLLEFQMEL